MLTPYPTTAPKVTIRPISQRLFQFFKARSNLRWNNFFRGYIDMKIQQLQADYLRSKDHPTPTVTSNRCSKTTTKQFGNIAATWSQLKRMHFCKNVLEKRPVASFTTTRKMVAIVADRPATS